MGEALELFVEEAGHIYSQFESQTVFSIGPWGVSQYIVWLLIAFVATTAILLISARKVQLVPSNKFVGLVEYLYGFVRKSVGEDVIGEGYEKHVPLLATLFFFILISNIIGLIPGAKTPTGSLSVTWALALISFVYFNAYGIKAKGGLGYIKSIAPSGLPKPMVPVIWFFEFFSLVIRLLTLAVRLYGNMFAGHMILGIFAIMTQFFILEVAMAGASVVVALPSIAWALFLLVMYALECLVAFLQAYVFTILSAVYVGLATSSH